MANITVQPPLSNVQAELLKLFSAGIRDSQLMNEEKETDQLSKSGSKTKNHPSKSYNPNYYPS